MTCENCCYKIEQSYGTNGECTYRDCGKPSDKPCPTEINEMENENMAEQKTEPQTCPYCGSTLHPTRAMNALSRWLRNTYICGNCGEFESFVDMYRQSAELTFTGSITSIAIAIKDKPGYIALQGAPLMPYKDAQAAARRLNMMMKDPVTVDDEYRIVASSMKAQNEAKKARK